MFIFYTAEAPAGSVPGIPVMWVTGLFVITRDEAKRRKAACHGYCCIRSRFGQILSISFRFPVLINCPGNRAQLYDSSSYS